MALLQVDSPRSDAQRPGSTPTRWATSTVWPSRLAILFILALTAALRWVQPGLVEFKYDEAHIIGMALGVAHGDAFPLLSGGTSLGIQRPALDVYLLALPLAGIARRPEAAVWWLGALAVVAAALTYALGKRLGGERVGSSCRSGDGCQSLAGRLRPQVVGAHSGGLQRAPPAPGLGTGGQAATMGRVLVPGRRRASASYAHTGAGASSKLGGRRLGRPAPLVYLERPPSASPWRRC